MANTIAEAAPRTQLQVPAQTSSDPTTSLRLPQHKASLLENAVAANALSFGTFTLKSGRISPFFFNAGLFHRGSLHHSLTTAYASTLAATSDLNFDVLFGPAYKGIPLASAVLSALYTLDPQRYGDTSYAFNRKEAKSHGEGGTIVGAPLKGKRVVIIDDVITAGTAIREAIQIINSQGGILVGIIVAFDRQEKTPAKAGEIEEDPRGSAIGQVREEHGVPVLSILNLDDVEAYLQGLGTEDDLRRLREYREKYMASD